MKNKIIIGILIIVALGVFHSCSPSNEQEISSEDEFPLEEEIPLEEEFAPIIIKPRTPGLSYDDPLEGKVPLRFRITEQTLLYKYEPYYMHVGWNFKEEYIPRNKLLIEISPRYVPQEYKDMNDLLQKMEGDMDKGEDDLFQEMDDDMGKGIDDVNEKGGYKNTESWRIVA